MNLITGRAGAAHITPRQDAMWHQGLIEMESCIFDAYENFAAEIITNNEVRIRSGVGMLQGRFFCIEPNTYDSAEIANGNQGEERIDLIVARIAVDASANTQSASIKVIQGTPAAENPTTPEAVTGDLDAGDLIADYPLAEVHISGINITSVENTFNAGWLSLPQTRQNINFIGTNPIESPEDDTVENWANLGSGVAFYDTVMLNVQPAQFGFLENITTGTTMVSQVFTSYTTGSICAKWKRIGSINYGWTEWKKILDEDTGIQRLWSNNNLSSAFSPQTLSLDMTDYPIIIMFFRVSTEYGGVIGVPALRGYESRMIGVAAGGATLRTRSFNFNSNEITIYGGYTETSANNNSCIPVAIYGLKGVQL